MTAAHTRGPALVTSVVAAIALVIITAARLDVIVPLPLGSHQGTLPLAYWAVVVVYGSVAARVSGLPLGRVLATAVTAGLLGHLALLIGSVPTRGAAGYGMYVIVAQALVMGAIAAIVAPRALRWARGASGAPHVWLLPAVLVALLAGTSLVDGEPWIGVAAVAGTVIGLRWPRAGIGPVSRWLADDRVVAAALFGASALVRTAFGARLALQTGADFPLASDDGDAYDAAAWGLATDTLPEDPGYRWPRGYWTFVAGVYRLFGHDHLRFAVIEGLLGALVPVFVFLVCRRVFGRTPGLIAGGLCALSGTLVWVSVVLGTEGIYATLIAGCLAAVLARGITADRAGLARMALAGVCVGLAITVKPQTLVFAGFLIVWLAFAPTSPAARRQAMLAFALAGAAAVAPFVAWDMSMYGTPKLFSAGGNEAFDAAIGREWKALGVHPYRDGWIAAVGNALARPGEAISVVSRLVPAGILTYLFGSWYGTFDPVLLDRFSEWAKELRLYGYAFAVVGLVAAPLLRRTRWEQTVLFVFVLSQITTVVFLGHPMVRYRIPSDPVFNMYLAVGIVVAARRGIGLAGGRRSGWASLSNDSL